MGLIKTNKRVEIKLYYREIPTGQDQTNIEIVDDKEAERILIQVQKKKAEHLLKTPEIGSDGIVKENKSFILSKEQDIKILKTYWKYLDWNTELEIQHASRKTDENGEEKFDNLKYFDTEYKKLLESWDVVDSFGVKVECNDINKGLLPSHIVSNLRYKYKKFINNE